VAIAGQRDGAELHYRHHNAERTLCRDPQSHAGDPRARDVAGVAREEPAEPAQLKALLAPYPADQMTLWPVDKRVGNVKNNDPSLIEPIAAAAALN
jgi:hypothetical protein